MKALVATVAVLVTFPALAESRTACSASAESWERSHQHWGYRILDGRKCWFALRTGEHRGEHRPIELLFWNAGNSAFDLRWNGDSSGWSHKE